VAVLDCGRERKAPHSPDDVVREFSEVLKSYAVRECVGDRHAGSWPREQYAAHGIEYVPSEKNKSTLYTEALAVVNGRRCELLDLPRVTAQLVGLERRSGFGASRDTVDHPPGGHDDMANAVAGCIVIVASCADAATFGIAEAQGLGVVDRGAVAGELAAGWRAAVGGRNRQRVGAHLLGRASPRGAGRMIGSTGYRLPCR
jgi:hypothetical protein